MLNKHYCPNLPLQLLNPAILPKLVRHQHSTVPQRGQICKARRWVIVILNRGINPLNKKLIGVKLSIYFDNYKEKLIKAFANL